EFDVGNFGNADRVVWRGVLFDAEKEVWRDEHGLNGELDALFDGLAFPTGHGNEVFERGDIGPRHGTAISAMSERSEDLRHAGRSGVGIANQHAFAAGAFDLCWIRPDELDHVQKL